jgi:hypothetical protein
MCVITSEDQEPYKISYEALKDQRCTNCAGRVWFPFLYWSTHTHKGAQDILLCSKCAHDMRNGFCSDLIQIAAIVDLKKFNPLHTLTRQDIRKKPTKQELPVDWEEAAE